MDSLLNHISNSIKQLEAFIPTLRGQFVVMMAALLAVTSPACTKKSRNEAPNTLHRYSPVKIKGLDPIFADDIYSGEEVSYSYEGLLQYHYLKRPYTLIPNLAESMPEVSADGKTYTFHIKKGVLFVDDPCFKESGGKGRELVAEDFIYSFKRLADPKLSANGWWIFDHKIQGINAWAEAAAKAGKTDYSKPIEGLKALDRYTLQIRLNQKSAQFLFSMAMQFTFVVPHEAVEMYGKEFINHAVGTGPFKLEEYSPSQRLIWTKNPTFRKELYPSEGEPSDQAEGRLEDAGKQIPFVDRVVVTIFEEYQPMWLTFMKGNLDYALIPKDNFAQAVTPSGELTPELKAKGMKLATYPIIEVTHTTFNMRDPILGKNKLLRQALSLALDTHALSDTFYNGNAIAAQGPIPPELVGYDPNLKNPYRQFNLEKAKELLAKAGYPEGRGLPPLQMLSQSDTLDRELNEFKAKMFQNIGVQIKLDTYSWPEFNAGMKNGRGQLWGFAWIADYPDAENFLQLFYSKNMSPGPNDSFYSNPEFDRLYEQALQLSDTPERTVLYRKMVAIIVEDAPWIFEVHRLGYVVLNPRFKNFKYNAFDLAKPKYFRVTPGG